jgi:protein transport protein SEC20
MLDYTLSHRHICWSIPDAILSLVLAFRKAQMAAKRSLEAARAQERQLLLQSYLDPTPDKSAQPVPQRQRNTQASELSKDEKTVNASTDVTLALRRTHDMMAAELSRSQFAHDTLKESTAALAQLSESYSALDTLLSSSRNLLGTLLRSQKSDTWYLETAFYILLTTVFWLIFRRLLYGPTWWLIWWPLKLLWGGSMGILGATGVVSRSGGSGQAGSVARQETAGYGSAASASMSGSGAPTISTGGKGTADPAKPEGASGEEESYSEKVGKIIDESRGGQAGDTVKDGHAAEEGNPKKRMWDAEKEASQEQKGGKDDL